MADRRDEDKGGRMGRRLKKVRKRKRALREYRCEVMALKLRLVKTREDDDR